MRIKLTILISICLILNNKDVFSQLSGTYTINSGLAATTSNYKDFTSTIDDMNGTPRSDGGPNHGSGGISGAVVFNVATGGVYNEQLSIKAVTGASAVNTITYNGNGSTIAFASNNASAKAVIKLNGARYFTFNNLNINATGGTYGYGIHLTGSAEYITINKCTVLSDSTFMSVYATRTNFAGIVASSTSGFDLFPFDNNGANHCTISNCLIVGGQVGIQIDGGGGGYISGNRNDSTKFSRGIRITNNTIRGFFSFGISFNLTDSIIIIGNDINRIYRKDATYFMIGITGKYDNYNYRIEKNRIHSFATQATTFESAPVNNLSEVKGISMRMLDNKVPKIGTIINNLIYDLGDNQLPSIDEKGIEIILKDPDRINILNNTIVYNSRLKPSKDFCGIFLSPGLPIAPLISNVKNVQNNLISMHSSGGTGRNLGVYYYLPDVSMSSDYNVFDLDTTQSCVGTYGQLNTFYFYSLYDWQTLFRFSNNSLPVVVFDQHSIACNPFFKDTANGDYTPQNILIKNAGADWVTNGVVTTDINGKLRDGTPTVGAYEVSADSMDGGISILKFAQINLCGNSPVKVTLMNNGTTRINTATIAWSVNGVAQTPANFSTLNLISGATTNLVLGNYNFTSTDVASGYAVTATLSSINGTSDLYSFNNTATDTLKKGLSGTYTINKLGSYGANNFISFSQAADYLNNYGVCGPVVFNVLNGPYTDRMVLIEIQGVNAVNTITVNGNGQEINYLSSNHSPIIFLNGTDYYTLDSLILKARYGGAPRGILLKKHADHNIIKNCSLYGNFKDGVAILGNETTGLSAYNTPSPSLSDNTSYSTFDNNKIIGWRYGICINYLDAGDDGSTVTPSVGNKYTNNTFRNISGYLNQYGYSSGYALLLNNADSALISGNNISNPDSSIDTYGIYIARNVKRSIIERNKIHNIFDGAINQGSSYNLFYGFYLRDTYTPQPADVNIFRNNLIYDIKGTASIYGFYERNAVNTRFYHNTISFDDTTSTTDASKICAAYYNNASVNAQVYNNIFSVTRGGVGKNYGISATGSFLSDNNDYNIKGTNAFVGNNSSTLSDWQGTGKDVSSKDFDPLFLSAATGDFHPTEMQINDMGRNLQTFVPQDFDGIPRPVTPDPGIYEFGTTLPDTITTSAISPLIYCAGTSINIPFIAKGSYYVSNVFTAQLSDATGSFISPIILGTLSSALSGTHTITGIIPPATIYGTKYRIRVIANSPATIGTDNNQDITIIVSPDAGIISTSRDTICESTPCILSVTGNTSDIQWQSSPTSGNYSDIPGATNSTYTELVTNNAYFRVYTSDGTCSDTSNTIQVIVKPSPVAFFTSSIEGDQVIFSSAGTTGDVTIYNWNFGDGTSSSDANPVHTYASSDSFHVCLTVYNGSNCSFTICNELEVITGIAEVSVAGNFTVYPNPCSSILYIDAQKLQVQNCNIEILDMLGKVVLNENYKIKNRIIPIDVSGLAQGMYYLKITTTDSNYIKQVIKQ